MEINYINNFINSIKANKQMKKQFSNFDEVKNELLLNYNNKNLDFKKMIKELVIIYYQSVGLINLVNKCHLHSDNFRELLSYYDMEEYAYITVGNVYYKKENIYNLSKQKLKRIINEGKSLNKELDVHVWITLYDMSILDLTIMSTLKNKGLLNSSIDINNPSLIWKESLESDFYYEPLYIDNDFLEKVDSVKS
ncbi:hypothetical protein [Poseidonibacter antarcticus]|uniref:hypothetical protein n=1 Tax=Poseidonibacter antarcticus TaxID=2478538 RepID=UPI000EF4A82C|nr:hypothetical protein [Poseidonibacter antarcticus]